ncbi:MAG: class I adenylate-forming enzyme family protein [Gammaproteobacteria bacterium]
MSTPDLDALPARAHHCIRDWAARTPDRPAVQDPDRRLTYGELWRAIERAAATLREAGVRPGDRVLLLCENTVATVVYVFACHRLDAWASLVNARVPLAEAGRLRAVAAPRLRVYAIDGSPAAAEHARADRGRRVEDDLLPPAVLGEVDTQAAPEPVHQEGARQVALMMFTSGTTGQPKGVMISHRGLLNAGASIAMSRAIVPEDCVYGVAPMPHITGFSSVMASLYAGASMRLLPRFDAADLAAAIVSGAIQHFSLVPAGYARLLEHARRHGIDLTRHRIKTMVAAGAPLDPTLKRNVEALFGTTLGNAYGLTEFAPGARVPPGRISPAESVGFAEGGAQMRIVDLDGRDVAEGAIGELWLSGPAMMLGYYRNPEATAQAMRPGGWFATGDLVQRLGNGEIALVGRRKEMIIRSGFNVYPVEVEAAINEHLDVAQSAVVGRKAADGNEEIIAYVQRVPGAGLTEAALRAHVGTLLAPYKRPSRIVFMDALPIGPTGKIWKVKLAEQAAGLPPGGGAGA